MMMQELKISKSESLNVVWMSLLVKGKGSFILFTNYTVAHFKNISMIFIRDRYRDKLLAIEKEDHDKTEHLRRLFGQFQAKLNELAEKDAKLKELQQELAKFKAAFDGKLHTNLFVFMIFLYSMIVSELESTRSAKAKYKEMGKKMLDAMKQMDLDMKDLMKRLEEATAQLKAAEKEKRKLQRKNEELQRDMEMTEVIDFGILVLCVLCTDSTEFII